MKVAPLISKTEPGLDRFLGLGGADLIAAVHNEFGARFCVVSSFGTESAALLHLTATVDQSIPVIFLNTGKLFGETIRYQKTLVEHLGLENARSVLPDQPTVALTDPKGVLWAENANQCCFIRKVQSLNRALDGFEAWATGRKAYQGGLRKSLQPVEADEAGFKINPLAQWSAEDVQNYFEQHNLPRHPLEADGYASIGCMPCTTRTAPNESAREGRWRNQEKTECGIHLPRAAGVDGEAA
jgi:phosphoadenosine phosphosulfate reductase